MDTDRVPYPSSKGTIYMAAHFRFRAIVLSIAALALSFGSGRPALGQSFVQSYGTPTVDERFPHLGGLHPTSDGGFIALGNVYPGGGRWHLIVTKLNPAGAIEWRSAYVTFQVVAAQIRQTLDGGYVIGATLGRDTPLHAEGMVVLRLDPFGAILWQRKIGGFQRDILRSLGVTADNGVLIGGEAEATPRPAFGPPRHHLWVVRLNAAGLMVWQRTYITSPSPRESLQMTSFRVTPDNGAIISALDRDVRNSAYLLKLNAFGAVEWLANYKGMLWPSSASPTSDGGYVFTGTTFDSAPRLARAVAITRLDSAGHVVWTKRMADPRGIVTEDTAVDARETLDGGIVVAASTQTPGPSGHDVWIAKFDASGGLMWQTIYDNGRENLARLVEPTMDGGVVITGDSSARSSRSWDWLVIRLTESGVVPGCPDLQEAAGAIREGTVAREPLFVKSNVKGANPLPSDLFAVKASIDILERCGKPVERP